MLPYFPVFAKMYIIKKYKMKLYEIQNGYELLLNI